MRAHAMERPSYDALAYGQEKSLKSQLGERGPECTEQSDLGVCRRQLIDSQSQVVLDPDLVQLDRHTSSTKHRALPLRGFKNDSRIDALFLG